jgi:hypothetical protein
MTTLRVKVMEAALRDCSAPELNVISSLPTPKLLLELVTEGLAVDGKGVGPMVVALGPKALALAPQALTLKVNLYRSILMWLDQDIYIYIYGPVDSWAALVYPCI